MSALAPAAVALLVLVLATAARGRARPPLAQAVAECRQSGGKSFHHALARFLQASKKVAR